MRWTLFWWRKCCNYGSWEGHSLCSFEEFSESDEIGINTCLILQNTLDVTVTALAVQNKREHPNRVNKGFVETVVPDYCDPTLPRIQDEKTNISDEFQMHSYLRDCVMIYLTLLFLLWVLGLSLLLITVVVLWYCNIYHYIIRGA